MSELYGKAGWVESLWLDYEPSKIPPGLTARTIKAVGSYMAYRFGDQHGRNIYASAARIGRGVDGLHESKVKLARKQLERDGRLMPTGRIRNRVPEVALCYPDGRTMTRTLEGTSDRTLEGTQPHNSKTTLDDLVRTSEGTSEPDHSTLKATTTVKTSRTSEGTSHLADHLAHAKPYGEPTAEHRIACFIANPGCAQCRESAEYYAAMDDPWGDAPKAARAALAALAD